MEFSIDENSILSKLKDFAGTRQCSEIINKNVQLEPEMMLEAAEMFRRTLVDDMLWSPASNIADIPMNPNYFYADTPTRWVDEDGDGIDEWIVQLSFSEHAIRRTSLAKKKRGVVVGFTGEGIDNIISLFDTGYSQSKPAVRGWWLRHNKYVAAVRMREEIGFMKRAVDTFNRTYGVEYGCYAEIVADNKFYARK